MTHTKEHKQEKLSTPLFIHGGVDDHGIPSSAWRVMCHIARRGRCDESIPNMSRWLRLTEDTIWDALKWLVEHNVIFKEARPGRTTVFFLNANINTWKPTRGWNPPEKKGHPLKSGGTHRKRTGAHPPEKKGHKVTPTEVTPSKAINRPLPGSREWESENDFIDRCRDILGKAEIKTNGGGWRIRFRQNKAGAWAVLGDTKSAKAERRIKTTPAKYANDLWAKDRLNYDRGQEEEAA